MDPENQPRRGHKVSRGHFHDLFITHAWRFHADWRRATELLDGLDGFEWRNFSLPWHDPAIDPNTDVGGYALREFLEGQIIPVHGVVFLSGVYGIESARRWLDLELQLARKHRKAVVALPALGRTDVPEEVRALCDAFAPWDGVALLSALNDACDRAARSSRGHYTD